MNQKDNKLSKENEITQLRQEVNIIEAQRQELQIEYSNLKQKSFYLKSMNKLQENNNKILKSKIKSLLEDVQSGSITKEMRLKDEIEGIISNYQCMNRINSMIKYKQNRNNVGLTWLSSDFLKRLNFQKEDLNLFAVQAGNQIQNCVDKVSSGSGIGFDGIMDFSCERLSEYVSLLNS